CGRLHLKGAPFFVGDVLDKHHSTKELEPFSCFSDDVTFEIQDELSGNSIFRSYHIRDCSNTILFFDHRIHRNGLKEDM
ncbi:hypothetical protein, partial [Paenibacillus cookii]|uniref:hypothetical protein n=1 Tax=Paenibacillus cookii TaxID=157839 RepID=UPI001BB31E7D